jgi:acetyl/propionyl-CoA carboxylase alpha subunit/acetyl-CoA carboxylase carboxyltransferase component
VRPDDANRRRSGARQRVRVGRSMMEITRIAVVNRGEPAMRLMNAVAEYNIERGTTIKTIALYTDADRQSMFVREADEAVPIGPAHRTAADGTRRVAYVDYELLEEVLVASRADAVWVGWGFVSEHAAFVDLCDRLGITFIGPSAEVMRRLGDKITSKLIAEEAEVPVAPWSRGPVDTPEEAHAQAQRLGYPLMVKATAGGGGRGIRKVAAPEELDAAFSGARAEAASAFGDGTVFLEKMVAGARHVEVQIIGDAHGTVWAVGVRDCSVQRRNQKLIEEAPSPALSTAQEAYLKDAARRLGEAAGYQNAGTVQFLFDEATGSFSFLEVNSRLQVEHPVTELTTGIDMVKLQLDVAQGLALEGDPPPTVGHAIEVRLNAEDPEAGFSPSPGTVEMLRLPLGPGLRIDTGIEEGDDVAPEFDSMLAKIMAYGRTREEARSRLIRALGQMRVLVRNGASNKAFLESLLAHPDFVSGDIDVGWLDRLRLDKEGDDAAGVALIAAAISAYRELTALEMRAFRASAARGRPEVATSLGHTIELRYAGERYTLEVGRLSPATWRIVVDEVTVEVDVERLGRAGWRLRTARKAFRVLAASHGANHYVEVDGVAHRIAHDEGGVIRAPSPAVVVSLPVEPGDEVRPGDRIAVIEAMKMETSITADFAGTVREILVRENVQVAPGTPLLVIDATGDETETGGKRIDFGAIAVDDHDDHQLCAHYLAELRRMLLGWDVSPEHLRAMSRPGAPSCGAEQDAETLRAAEDEVLGIFVDIISLFRRHPVDSEIAESRRSSEEYLFSYLRDIDASSEGLPERFIERIRRTVGHYGITDLEVRPRLEQVLLRIAKSYARMHDQTAPLLQVLEDRIERGQPRGDDSFRRLLEKLIHQTRGRYDMIHDMAREVHYQTYDVPFLQQVRDATYAGVDGHLAALAEHPEGPGRHDHMRALVDCTQPLASYVAERLPTASPVVRALLLEVMVRRYYRIRELGPFSLPDSDTPIVASSYELDGRSIAVLATFTPRDELAAASRRLREVAMAVDTDDVVVDLHVRDRRTPAGEPATGVRDVLDEELGGLHIRRIVVSTTGDDGAANGHVHHATFRSADGDVYREDPLYRDVHPMMAKRLEIWRLSAFDVERIPTAQDVFVFKGVAKENPRDQRLFAFAEVRDITPIRDSGGRVIRIPEAERVYRETLAPIRRYQARLPLHRRLWWNQVMINVWPLVDFNDVDVARFIERLAPATEGLGLRRVTIGIRILAPDGSVLRRVLEISNPSGGEVQYRVREPGTKPIHPLRPYDQAVVRLRQRGLTHPYELIKTLASPFGSSGSIPEGHFVEHELEGHRLVPVDRPPGQNQANVVVGLVTNTTARYPDGMTRVIILSDPTRGMGNLSEPECRRIVAALDLADERGIPVEWFAVSAGALISMESGTENMDWIGAVLRRIVEFTQAGGEINIVVAGVNVGAQPYWNAEATMLMHTKGILVMIPTSAMVLTGKEALDYSGGVSAEDNQGIGGYERIMGPNGQAQYFAEDITEACRILLQHYEYTYTASGERFPRPAETDDPVERDITDEPHPGEFATVGDVFSEETNPGRKKPFEMRAVMKAVVDADLPWLERWYGMQGAEMSIVWDAYIGGRSVTLIGFESKPMPRLGAVPADGPSQWTSGTLFPLASKKTARAINAASGNRPVVVLANLSGFDGSPESMREWQLEYGAEIGRAIVNFDGPMIFCVVSRYHGGAFVVFSHTLHDNLEVAAVEGSRASVIGGAPAAAVVFAREVRRRVEADERVTALRQELDNAGRGDRARLGQRLEATTAEVRSEKLGEVAAEFDAIHDIERARDVGSVHRIVPPATLRTYLVEAVRRGIARELDGGPDSA